MGYRIVYGKDPVCRNAAGTGRLRVMTAAAMLLFVVLVRCAWPEGREILRDVLIPEERMIAAFSDMVAQVDNGQGIGEAVTAFCRTVVEHGRTE